MLFHDIETERLHLKCIARDDREFMLRQFSDPDVTRYLFDAEPMASLNEADKLIAFYVKPEPREQHRWIIIMKDSGEKIGTCGFHCWDRKSGAVEVGYDLQKAYWGRGIMSEAMRAILPFAFNEMGVNKIDAHIYAGNDDSVRLAQRLGFEFRGETTVYTFMGTDYPHNIYTLNRPGAK